jgi:diguanylate cyclase (GGDEF)-like protein/PAS domain S-box-containing protein
VRRSGWSDPALPGEAAATLSTRGATIRDRKAAALAGAIGSRGTHAGTCEKKGDSLAGRGAGDAGPRPWGTRPGGLRAQRVGPAAYRALLEASSAALLELVKVRDELRASEARGARERRFLRVLLDNLDEGIVACDANGSLTVSNPAARRLHGARLAPVGGDSRGVELIGRDGSVLPERETPLARALRGERVRGLEMVIAARGERPRTVLVNAQAMHDEKGEKLGAMVAIRDITDQRAFEQQLAKQALHDPLTGLANRVLLAERMRMSLELARSEGLDVAVLMIGLEGLDALEEELGEEMADKALVALSDRLTGSVRPSDIVARLGRGELAVVCSVSRRGGELDRLVSRLEAALAPPYAVEGRLVRLRASIGAAITEASGEDPAEVLNDADLAMRRA